MTEQLGLVIEETGPQSLDVYIHNQTGERLVVGTATAPGTCDRCRGLGQDPDKHRCGKCEGSGNYPGLVCCFHPRGQATRELKLLWGYREFIEAFHKQDPAAPTGLF